MIQADIYDIFVYTAQVIVFQFIASPVLSLFAYKQALAKNKQWVLKNPKILQSHRTPSPKIPRLVGSILLLTIAAGSFVANGDALLKLAHYGSIFVFLLQHLGFDYWTQKKIKDDIPSPAIRTATLTLRKISDFVPPPWFLVSVIVMLASLSGWGYLWIHDLSTEQKVFGTLWRQIVVCGIALSVMIYCVKRKPIVADTKSAIFYRKSEVYVSFFIFLSFVVDSVLRLAGTSMGIEILTARAVDYIYTIIPMAVFVWFGSNQTFKSLINEDFSGAGQTT